MAPTPPSAAPHTLALAVVAASASPLLLLDGDLRIVAVSASFVDAFALNGAPAVGRFVFELDHGRWDSPRLRSMLAVAVAGTPVDAYELDLHTSDQGTRRLVLKASRLDYAGGADRLLLAVADVTNARAAERLKDDLIRDKGVLLQELQHRVANSLQIIASVLMQSARGVSSDEVRGHLHDAHNRVMSIAAVQKHLAQTNAGAVAMRPYLTDLCTSIGASMIADHARVALAVSSDDCTVAPNVSVSIGLIVTELVINAIKHAFPGDRAGTIAVAYAATGANWTLSVRDDGVSMGTAPAPAGLGTSLIQALAGQLHAQIRIEPGNPGTRVAVAHTHLRAVSEKVVAAL